MADIRRTLQGLPPFSRHVVRVRGYNQLGVASDWSEALNLEVPGDSSRPNPPSNLEFDFFSPDLLITWDYPTHNTDGTILNDFSRYKVALTATNSLNVVTTKVYETVSPFFSYSFNQNRIDFGEARSSIAVAIRAVDVTGNESGALLGTAVNPVPLDAPDAPTLSAAFTLVTVSMTPHPTDRDISGYEVEHSNTGAVDSYFVVGRTVGDTYTHAVTMGTNNYYRYRPIDIFGQKALGYSPIANITTRSAGGEDAIPPPAPTNLAGVAGLDAVTQRPYVDLSWTPSVPQEDDLNRYQLRWQKVGDAVANYTVIAPQASTYRLTGLDEESEYSFTLYAYDHWGNGSDPSETITVTTGRDTQPPALPSGLEAVSGIRAIILRWEPNTDFDFDVYELYGSLTPNFTADTTSFSNRIFRGNVTQYVHRTADRETWYFKLRALDRNGNATAFTDELEASSLSGYTRPIDESGDEEPFIKFGQGETSLTISNLATRGLYMGSDDWNTAPFYARYTGEVLARNIIITGDLMAENALIIDTPSFKVSKEGLVTAAELVANGGTIGSTTITEDRLLGGVIEGTNFVINSAVDAGITFTGSGNITWQAGAEGKIIVSDQGAIQSANFDSTSRTGWRLGSSGLTIGNGMVSATSLQIGVANTNLLLNSSFETGSSVAISWSIVQDGATGEYLISGDHQRFQARSQRILCTMTGAGLGISQNATLAEAIPADTPVAVSIWAKQTAGTSKQCRIYVFDADGALISQSNPLTLSAEWDIIRWTFVTAKQEAQLRYSFIVEAPEISDVYYVDGAMMQLSNFASDYTPAPAELPENYIHGAWISSLSADRLRTGTIGPTSLQGSVHIRVGPNGTISNAPTGTDFATIPSDASTWMLDNEGAFFQNGTISIVGAQGHVTLSPTQFSASYGTSTGLLINDTGVYLGGNSALTAGLYFNPADGKTTFQSTTGLYRFQIDTRAQVDNRVLRLSSNLSDPATDTFYLTSDGAAYFFKGVIGLGSSNNMFNADDTGRVWVGAGPDQFHLAPFRIYSDGSMVLQLKNQSLIQAGTSLNGVLFDQSGIRMTRAGITTVNLPVSGSPVFTGTITASAIVGNSSITGGTISGTTISGTSITGSSMTTSSSSGREIRISGNQINFTDASGNRFGHIWTVGGSGNYVIVSGPTGSHTSYSTGVIYNEVDEYYHINLRFVSSSYVRFNASADGDGHTFMRLGDGAGLKGLAGGGLQSRNGTDSAYRDFVGSNISPSRRDFKKDIKPFVGSAVSAVKSVRPSTFRWDDDRPDDREELGFIADELPEIVRHPEGYSTNGMIAFLWRALQEQQEQITELTSRIPDPPTPQA